MLTTANNYIDDDESIISKILFKKELINKNIEMLTESFNNQDIKLFNSTTEKLKTIYNSLLTSVEFNLKINDMIKNFLNKNTSILIEENYNINNKINKLNFEIKEANDKIKEQNITIDQLNQRINNLLLDIDIVEKKTIEKNLEIADICEIKNNYLMNELNHIININDDNLIIDNVQQFLKLITNNNYFKITSFINECDKYLFNNKEIIDSLYNVDSEYIKNDYNELLYKYFIMFKSRYILISLNEYYNNTSKESFNKWISNYNPELNKIWLKKNYSKFNKN